MRIAYAEADVATNHRSLALKDDVQLKLHARIRDVAQVINASVVDNVHIVVIAPISRPRLYDDERVAAVLEARLPFDDLRVADVEVMFTPEVRTETVIGNSSAASASRLLRALLL
jgi:hypothetical protein